MKLLKIVRSVITSLLFIVLIGGLVIDSGLILLRHSGKRLSDLIDRDVVLNATIEDNRIINDTYAKEELINYINDYINYVFYKRSYPTINFNNIDNKNLSRGFEIIRNKFNLDEYTIINLRKINSLISNNAIFLLLNIFIFVIFLFLWIVYGKIEKTIKLLSYAFLISSILIMILGSRIYGLLFTSSDRIIFSLLLSVANSNFKKMFYKVILIYIIIGLILLLGGFVYKKLKNNVAIS